MRDRRSLTRAPIGAAAFLYTGWAAAPVTRRFTGGACAAATSAGALTATIANAMMRFTCPPLDATYRHLRPNVSLEAAPGPKSAARPASPCRPRRQLQALPGLPQALRSGRSRDCRPGEPEHRLSLLPGPN